MVDIVFKSFFGSREHPRLTLSLLNAVLAEIGHPLVETIEILNPFQPGSFLGNKDAILDIRAQDQLGRSFQVEMQMVSNTSIPQRMLHNLAQVYSGSLKKGSDWSKLTAVVAIWFFKERFAQNRHWIETWAMRSLPSGLTLHEDLTMVTVDLTRWDDALKKLSPRGSLNTKLDRWNDFFWRAEELDPQDLPVELSGTEFEEAVEIMAEFTLIEKVRDLYQRREEYRREMAQFKADRDNALAEGRQEGRQEGRLEGRREGLEEGRQAGEREATRELARKMLSLGLPQETIRQTTGLSSEDLASLGGDR